MSNLISVADVDSGTADIQTTLAIETGTLTLNAAALGALTSVVGDGTDNVVLTGTAAEINAALNGLIYNPGTNYNGDRTLTVTTNDLGNSGNDPGLTGTLTSEQDQDVIQVDVTAVNDAPTVIGDGTEEADADHRGHAGPGPDRLQPVRRPIFGRRRRPVQRRQSGRLVARLVRRHRRHRQRLERRDRPVAIFRRRDLGRYRRRVGCGRQAARRRRL